MGGNLRERRWGITMETKSKNEIITQKLWVIANNFYNTAPTAYVDGYEMPLPYAKKLVANLMKELTELQKEMESN
jgi:hypothetical protein